MKPFHTEDTNSTQGSKWRRSGIGDGADARVGSEGIGTTDCAELRARGYVVKPEVTAGANGKYV
jgi:hypothetical protein